MLTPDSNGKIWNPGIKLGTMYGILAGILVAALDYAVHNMETPPVPLIYAFLVIAPIASASHAYALGQRRQVQTGQKEDGD